MFLQGIPSAQLVTLLHAIAGIKRCLVREACALEISEARTICLPLQNPGYPLFFSLLRKNTDKYSAFGAGWESLRRYRLVEPSWLLRLIAVIVFGIIMIPCECRASSWKQPGSQGADFCCVAGVPERLDPEKNA